MTWIKVLVGCVMAVALVGGTVAVGGVVVDASPVGRADPLEVEVTRDVRFGDDRGTGWLDSVLDVYAPTSGGPWPVVVIFHGGGGQANSKATVEIYARVAAARGAVVFAPNVGGPSADPDSRDFRILTDPSASCATAFALDRASTYGGDPARLRLAGFSGGAVGAAGVARSDSWGDTDFCHVKPGPVDPESLVLWEGDWLLTPWWDDALEANPSWYPENAVWYTMDKASGPIWNVMLGDPDRVDGARLAVGDPFGSGDECDREIPPGEPGGGGGLCRTFDLRDPSEALRREADRLGQFDDGWWTIGEWSLLLADQLAANGVAQTVTMIPGATHGALTLEGFQAFIDLVLQDPPGSPTTTTTTTSTTTTSTTAPPTTTTVAASPEALSPTFTG